MILTLVVGCGVDPSSLPEVHDPVTDELDPCEVPGNICTWLGVPGQGRQSGEGTDRSDDLQTGTYLFLPADLTFGPDGTAWYSDFNNHRIRKVSPDGVVTTISGTGMLGDGPNTSGSTINCWNGCPALESAWNHPSDIRPDPFDPEVLWVAAWHNSRINRIDLRTSTMTWWAGTGGRFFHDGPRDEAIFDLPSSLVVAPDGSLIVADAANHALRRIFDDRVETFAGEPRMPGYDGDGGPAIDAHLHGQNNRRTDPSSRIVLDGFRLYIADTVNGVIRTIDLDRCGVVEHPYGDYLDVPKQGGCAIEHFAGRYESVGSIETTDAITGDRFTHDGGSLPGYSGDGGDADDAVFDGPYDVAVGPRGDVYVVDHNNHCVRVIHPDHTIETFAGRCTEFGFEGDGGPATEALLWDPLGIEVDAAGNLYIADRANHVIRRVKVAEEE
jgi:DNA-binding beta-propeller fold protein YncE